jgi:hypothetical protein
VTTREEFLSHLRNKAPTPANLPHPFVPVAEMPAVQYVRELSDPRRAFTEAATRVGATVREVDDLARLLADVVREYDVHTAVVSADPETADVPDALQRLDVQVVRTAPRGLTWESPARHGASPRQDRSSSMRREPAGEHQDSSRPYI